MDYKDIDIFLKILNNFIHPFHEISSLAHLKSEDICILLHMARDHAVFPIVYEGLRKAGALDKLTNEQQKYYKRQVKELVVGQSYRTSIFLILYQELSVLEIPMLVVKGIICRNMYGRPDYRSSCDEDILIRREDFYTLDQALQERGFQRNKFEDPLKEQEVTYNNKLNGLHLEVHMDLFSEESRAYGHLNQEFQKVFDNYVVENIKGVDICTLSYTDHMMYLLCHGLKHFLHSGFGIRQLCDMVLFAETYGEKIDWEELKRRTKKENMYVFWMNLFDIGEKKLGFSWEKAGLRKPAHMKTDSQALLEDLMDSGIYGKRSENRLHSANITLQAASENKLSVKESLFPEFSYMVHQYPYLEKYKWLLPWAWLQRIGAYFKNRNVKETMEVVEIGKNRTNMLKQYGLIGDSRQKRSRK